MPTKPIVEPGGKISQAANRYPDTYYDQHKDARLAPDGRPWWGYREFAANRGNRDGFVGSVSPGVFGDINSAWSAPFDPPEKYFDFNHQRSRITIRWDKMANDDRLATVEYYTAANRIAVERSWPELEYGEVPRFAIRAIIGPPPRSPKIAQAAQAGDRWLLGFTTEVNEELAGLLGYTRTGLRMENAEPAPAAQAGDVISMTREGLAAFVAAEVAKIQAATPVKPRRPHRRTRPLPETTVAPAGANAA